MNLFVTGGVGFIGTNFVRLALERGHHILNYDALTYAGSQSNVADLEGNTHQFVHGNICDVQKVRETFKAGFAGKAFDAVINFAAESHVDRSIYGARLFSETNMVGVATLIEAAREAGVPTFIQISTDEVYGSLGSSGLFTLDSSLKPSNPYSASKTAGDLIALSIYHTWGYDVRITRCTNNYGAYQFPEKFVPLIITNAIRGEKISVYGDGMNVRDWIYVRDHCEGIFAVLERGTAGSTYLFGGSTEKPNIELCRTVLSEIAKLTNVSPDSLFDLMHHVADRPGHDKRYAIDWSRTEKEIGWKPTTSFDDGLQETVQWYIRNRSWWELLLHK